MKLSAVVAGSGYDLTVWNDRAAALRWDVPDTMPSRLALRLARVALQPFLRDGAYDISSSLLDEVVTDALAWKRSLPFRVRLDRGMVVLERGDPHDGDNTVVLPEWVHPERFVAAWSGQVTSLQQLRDAVAMESADATPPRWLLAAWVGWSGWVGTTHDVAATLSWIAMLRDRAPVVVARQNISDWSEDDVVWWRNEVTWSLPNYEDGFVTLPADQFANVLLSAENQQLVFDYHLSHLENVVDTSVAFMRSEHPRH